MISILTSSPTKEINETCPLPALDERNGFIDLLKHVWKSPSRCLMIAAFPDAYDRNDEMTWFYSEAVKNAGLPWSCFDLWDDRLPALSREELQRYDVIFLAGGHVPTEWKWFESIGLKEKLEGYEGIVLGTSAGSMNMAVEVYGWPEEEGESCDPNHRLFFAGLGLAKTVVLPHYQKIRDNWLDGRRLMEDITCSHSFGKKFYAIPDGSFVWVQGGKETLYGEARLVSEGEITSFSWENQIVELSP